MPQTLYEDGSTLGSFCIAGRVLGGLCTSATSASISTTVGVPVMTTISYSLSGGPDNNFTSTVTVATPTGSTTLTVSAAAAGVYTVYVKASATNFPSVTLAITVTVT
jgi:hypothetical protein